jgi:hypothetical protein
MLERIAGNATAPGWRKLLAEGLIKIRQGQPAVLGIGAKKQNPDELSRSKTELSR